MYSVHCTPTIFWTPIHYDGSNLEVLLFRRARSSPPAAPKNGQVLPTAA